MSLAEVNDMGASHMLHLDEAKRDLLGDTDVLPYKLAENSGFGSYTTIKQFQD